MSSKTLTKRRREPPNVDTELVEIFEDLASESEEVRIKAAHKLLIGVSASNDASNNSSSSFRTPGEHQHELEKILKRLMRGLCSGRKAARLGFSVALTEFLTLVVHPPDGNEHQQRAGGASDGDAAASVFSPSGVVRALTQQTGASGHMERAESRDYYFGSVFGAEAIIKSKILFAADGDMEAWQSLLDLVFGVAQKKIWLREECGWILYEALRVLPQGTLGMPYAKALLDALEKNSLSRTAEGVALWIRAKSSFAGLELPNGVFEYDDPLHKNGRRALADVLVHGASSDPALPGKEKAKNQGWRSPNLSFAWEVIFDELLEKVPDRVKFSKMWEEAVDDGLFAPTSSDERKYLGFLVLERYLKVVKPSKLHQILGKNLVKCFINQISQDNRHLHFAAERARKTLLKRAQEDPDTVPFFVEALASKSGRIDFDFATKTKTISKLIESASYESLLPTLEFVKTLLVHPHAEEGKDVFIVRQGLVDTVVSTFRSRAYPEHGTIECAQCRKATMVFLATLADFAFFETIIDRTGKEIQPDPLVSKESREMFGSRLSSCLNHVVEKEAEKTFYPSKVVAWVRQRDEGPKGPHSIFAKATDKKVQEVVDTALTRLEHQSSQADTEGDGDAAFEAFRQLIPQLVLQVYNGDPDAVGMLQDIESSRPAKRGIGEGGEGIGTLVEIVLSLMSKQSLLLRRLAKQVFVTCVRAVDKEGIASLLRVLAARESAEGMADLFDDAQDDSAMDMNSSDADEGSEVGAKNSDEGDSASSEEEMEVDDEPGSEDNEASLMFESDLAKALGTRKAADDMAIEHEESTDESLDDEQMKAFDAHLENMFRERKKTKSKTKENKEARESMFQFKCRVIELLEIYVKEQYCNPIACEIIVPTLELAGSTKSSLVSGKAADLIRQFSKAVKPRDVINRATDAKALAQSRTLLSTVHEMAMRNGSGSFRSASSTASILLVKMVLRSGGSIEEAWSRYAETGTKMTTDENCFVKNSFFTDWLMWCTSIRQEYLSPKRDILEARQSDAVRGSESKRPR